MELKCLGKIASKVGKPILTDKLTSTKERLSYARVLVEVDESKELVQTNHMKLPTGKSRNQEVVYEHIPKFCATCKMSGHLTAGCNVNTQPATSKEAAQRKTTKTNDKAQTIIAENQQNSANIQAATTIIQQNTAVIKTAKNAEGGENDEGQLQNQGDNVENQFTVVSRNEKRNSNQTGTNSERQKMANAINKVNTKVASNEKLKGKLDDLTIAAIKKDIKKGNTLRISS